MTTNAGGTKPPVDNTKVPAIASGICVALSFVVVDKLLLNYGAFPVLLLVLTGKLGVLLSAGFVTSLVGGYFVGRAKVYDSAAYMIVFGVTWFISLFGTFLLLLNYGVMTALAGIYSESIGGLGLAYFRYLQGKMKVDGIFGGVLLASTMINIAYFVIGG